jgi:hypothetical protein
VRFTTSAGLGPGFWRTAALTVMWATLPTGLYGAFTGSAGWGAVLTVVGLAALIVGATPSVIRWASARPASIPLAALLVAAIALGALTELWMAARPSPLLVAPKAVALRHAQVLLVLAGVTAWQVARSRVWV